MGSRNPSDIHGLRLARGPGVDSRCTARVPDTITQATATDVRSGGRILIIFYGGTASGGYFICVNQRTMVGCCAAGGYTRNRSPGWRIHEGQSNVSVRLKGPGCSHVHIVHADKGLQVDDSVKRPPSRGYLGRATSVVAGRRNSDHPSELRLLFDNWERRRFGLLMQLVELAGIQIGCMVWSAQTTQPQLSAYGHEARHILVERWRPPLSGFLSSLILPTTHDFLAAASSFDYGRRVQTTEGLGLCSLGLG